MAPSRQTRATHSTTSRLPNSAGARGRHHRTLGSVNGPGPRTKRVTEQQTWCTGFLFCGFPFFFSCLGLLSGNFMSDLTLKLILHISKMAKKNIALSRTIGGDVPGSPCRLHVEPIRAARTCMPPYQWEVLRYAYSPGWPQRTHILS